MGHSEVKSNEGREASAVEEYLAGVLEDCGEGTTGELSKELPAPGSTDPALHALALATSDGTEYSAGHDEHLFTIQSISKPFVYALAIDDIGLEEVEKTWAQSLLVRPSTSSPWKAAQDAR